MLRKLLFLLFSLVTIMAMGQTAQTKKQSLPKQPGFVLQDGTVYIVDQTDEDDDKTLTLDGNSTGGFINGLAVAENATVTLYIPAGITLTVIGQKANVTDAAGNVIESQKGAGAGIYVPASSTLYITGEGTLIAKGGDGGNGGKGGDGINGKYTSPNGYGGAGGAGGYGGGGGAAAIGGNGGEGGATVAGAPENITRKSKKQDQNPGANGNPMIANTGELDGNNGSAGVAMGKVYILGKVTVQATAGGDGQNGGNAGTRGGSIVQTGNGQIKYYVGGGGAGAGGGAGVAATYGIGGGGAGAGSGAAGASGAVDQISSNKITVTESTNTTGNGESASAAGEGAANGSVINSSNDKPRDTGSAIATNGTEALKRYGGYGGTVGGKAGAQGDNGTVYIKYNNEATYNQSEIGNLSIIGEDAMEEKLSALNVDIKLNFLNDGNPSSDVLSTKFGECYTKLPEELIPTRLGYDFVGFFTHGTGGEQVFDAEGNPTNAGARCMFVQGENPTLYAHWILSTYTITWNYQYYDVDEGAKLIPVDERSIKANVVLRLNDGSTYNMEMTNPSPSETQTTHTVYLKETLPQDVLSKVVAVEKVEPVEIGGSTNKVLMTLDYISESSAKIFYDPTRYMVKWNVSVNATEKPEYIILTVKRGTSDATADGDIATDKTQDPNAEDANIVKNLRIRKNSAGKYSGSAVLKYEESAGNAFHYSVSVVGVRDDSGHEYMFPIAENSKNETSGVMYCNKPTELVPSPSRNIPEILLTVNLKKLNFKANNGTLDDGSPENIWAPIGTAVTLKDGTDYPYTATRLNYNFEGWNTASNATVGLDNITLNDDQEVYAVFMDRTPPTITFGDYTSNSSGAAEKYNVPVTISDAISEKNIVYYTVYDTNPGDIDVDSEIWNDNTKVKSGNINKKTDVVKVNFNTTSVVYVHVKAVDETGNAAVASKEIKVDTEAPVVRAYPNLDTFCATDVEVDITDNVSLVSYSIKRDGNDVTSTLTTEGITNGKNVILVAPKGDTAPTQYVYTITATDAALNETVRTITIYKAHNFTNGTDIAATEPTADTEGYFRYKKCEHCSHIILLRGDYNDEIDITDEDQRGRWIIPAGAVMQMTEMYSGVLDIAGFQTYVNDAITTVVRDKNNNPISIKQVRLSKDTSLSATLPYNTLASPSSGTIDLELNGHGLLIYNPGTRNTPASEAPGTITGNSKVTILLSDGNNRGKADGHTKEYATDIISYTNQSPVTVSPIKYTRKFSDIQQGNWQALYLPFEFTYDTSDFNLAQLDTDESTDFEKEGDGHVVLKVKKVEANSTATVDACTPLFISSNTDKLELVVRGQTLPAATSHTANHNGMFIGTLYDSPESDENNPFWVMLNNGNIWYAKKGQTQRPYRWVIQPTSGSGVKSISFQLVEDADDIKEVNQKRNDDGSIYTIDGRKVPSARSLQPGIYIVNGKKMVIK